MYVECLHTKYTPLFCPPTLSLCEVRSKQPLLAVRSRSDSPSLHVVSMGKEVDMKDAGDKTGPNKAGSVDKKAAEPVKKAPETPAEILAG